MASWIRKHKFDSPRLSSDDCDDDDRSSHAGHDIDDGYQVDRPDGIDPLDDEAYERLRWLMWSDLHQAGMPLRNIAAMFGVSKNCIHRAIAGIPESFRVDRRPSNRYFDGLREVVALKPQSLDEFTELLQRRAGTFGFERIIFHNAGIHRSSVATVLGKPRKSQAKTKGAA